MNKDCFSIKKMGKKTKCSDVTSRRIIVFAATGNQGSGIQNKSKPITFVWVGLSTFYLNIHCCYGFCWNEFFFELLLAFVK